MIRVLLHTTAVCILPLAVVVGSAAQARGVIGEPTPAAILSDTLTEQPLLRSDKTWIVAQATPGSRDRERRRRERDAEDKQPTTTSPRILPTAPVPQADGPAAADGNTTPTKSATKSVLPDVSPERFSADGDLSRLLEDRAAADAQLPEAVRRHRRVGRRYLLNRDYVEAFRAFDRAHKAMVEADAVVSANGVRNLVDIASILVAVDQYGVAVNALDLATRIVTAGSIREPVNERLRRLTLLGDALQRSGQAPRAVSVTRTLLESTEARYGDGDYRVGLVLADLADRIATSGDFAAAANIGERSLLILTNTLGPLSVETGKITEILARIYATLDDRPQVIALAETTAVINEQLLGRLHERTLGAYLALVSELERGRRNDEAYTIAAEFVSRTEPEVQELSPTYRRIVGYAAYFHQENGDWEAAIRYHEMALPQLRRVYKPGQIPILLTRLNLALAKLRLGKTIIAFDELRDIVHISSQSLGPNHEFTTRAAQLFQNLSTSLQRTAVKRAFYIFNR